MTDLAAPILTEYATRWRPAIDAAIDLAIGQGDPPELYEAMRYATLGPGKRIRPLVLLAACEAAGGDSQAALPAAAAIEMVHAFSLVHDDLPCMDDDDFRRGRPTCHKAFGEAVALLAGDALLARALAHLAALSQAWGRLAAAELAEAVAAGMVPGQVLDMKAEGPAGSGGGRVDVARLHALKTGRLFEAATRMGALAAGAPEEVASRLAEFGAHLGLAFQIADDLLDAGAGQADEARGKATYPARFGTERARNLARVAANRALAAVAPLGQAGATLRAIGRYVIERER